jgi:hypothetical protein
MMIGGNLTLSFCLFISLLVNCGSEKVTQEKEEDTEDDEEHLSKCAWYETCFDEDPG